MKLLAATFLTFPLFVSISCGYQNSATAETESGMGFGREEPKSPEELRAELKRDEQLAPLQYISGENIRFEPQQIQTRRAGLFHDAEYAPDGAIITGRFTNSATLARFKDVQLKLEFYSATNTLIDEETYIVYKYVNPSSGIPFSFKIASYPDAMDHFSAEIVGAKAVE